MHLPVPGGRLRVAGGLYERVLTIRAARHADYYEAREFTREAYYAEAGRAPDLFCGREAKHLGLAGPPEAGQLQALLEGRHPVGGERLAGLRAGRRNAGFDLTFTAPKSVSLLLALGDERVRQAVLSAHEAGVAAGLDYLERHELGARRGAQGARIVTAHGFVGARYTHEMSRAGDPHLHTHVVVANAVRGPDGRYSAPDMRPIYHAAKTAGTIAEAVLRHELTRSLGVEWGAVRSGTRRGRRHPRRGPGPLLRPAPRDRRARRRPRRNRPSGRRRRPARDPRPQARDRPRGRPRGLAGPGGRARPRAVRAGPGPGPRRGLVSPPPRRPGPSAPTWPAPRA